MKKFACFAVCCVVFGTFYWHQFWRPMPFSSEHWKNNSHRLQMVDDLIDSELLIGKTCADLREILGDDSGSCFVGSEWRQFPFSSVLLYTEMENGKVVHVYRHNKF